MSDNNQVLKNGTGTPYLAIFDGSKKAIIEPITNMPVGMFVTSFQYDYIEDGPDEGNLIIECGNPDIGDLPQFGYEMPLFLQWGYIFSDKSQFCGPLRKVIIIGCKVTFAEQGVRLEIDFADATVLLKNQPSEYFTNGKSMNGFYDYFMNIAKNNLVACSLVDYSVNPQYNQVIVQKGYSAGNDSIKSIFGNSEKVGNNMVLSYSGMETSDGIPLARIEPRDASIDYKSAAGVMLFSIPTNCSDEKAIEEYKKLMEHVKKYPEKYQIIQVERNRASSVYFIGTPKNKYSQIRQFSKGIPSDDTMYMDGRDGKLTIHNRQYNRPVSKTYTYFGGSGELLSFEVDSSYNRTSVSVSKTSNINPLDKSIDNVSVQINSPVDTPNGKVVLLQEPKMNWFDRLGSKLGLFWHPWDFLYNGGKSTVSSYSDNRVSSSSRNYKKGLIGDAMGYREIPNDVRNLKQFESEEDAIQYYNSTPDITQNELNEYLKKMQRQFELYTHQFDSSSQLSEEDFGILIHHLNEFPVFKLKRKFIIREYKRNQTIDEYQYWNSKSDVVVNYVHSESTNRDNPTFTIGLLRIVEKEIEIDGIKVLTSDVKLNSEYSMGNDILNSLVNSVEASARIVGDPTIESSMNLEILNVSKAYSGVWYTKKVTHLINQSIGYTCDIEFVKRDKTLSKTTIKSSVKTNNYIGNLRKYLRENKDAGTAVSKIVTNLSKLEKPTFSDVIITQGKDGKYLMGSNRPVVNSYLDNLDNVKTEIPSGGSLTDYDDKLK